MTTDDNILFEGEIRELTGNSEGIVIRGNKVLRTSHFHERLLGRRVRVVAADPAPTDEGDRGLIDYAHEWLLEQEVATEHGDLIRDLTAALEAWQDRAADPAPTDPPNPWDHPEVQDYINELLANAGDEYDDDVAASEIAMRYVRDLEAERAAADPAPTDHVRRARRRSVGVVTPRMIATDTALDMPGPDTTEDGR